MVFGLVAFCKSAADGDSVQRKVRTAPRDSRKRHWSFDFDQKIAESHWKPDEITFLPQAKGSADRVCEHIEAKIGLQYSL